MKYSRTNGLPSTIYREHTIQCAMIGKRFTTVESLQYIITCSLIKKSPQKMSEELSRNQSLLVKGRRNETRGNNHKRNKNKNLRDRTALWTWLLEEHWGCLSEVVDHLNATPVLVRMVTLQRFQAPDNHQRK